MEIRIVWFLGCVMVAIGINTVIFFFAYKKFAGLTSKVTSTLSDIRPGSETRQLIESLQSATAQAAALTETTKIKMAEIDPLLARAQEDYRRKLVEVDSKLEKAAENINSTARQVRDTVAKPAFSVATFAAGIAKVLQDPESEK